MTHAFSIGQLVRFKGAPDIFEMTRLLLIGDDGTRLYTVRGRTGERVAKEDDLTRA
jgi:hypothetical protein